MLVGVRGLEGLDVGALDLVGDGSAVRLLELGSSDLGDVGLAADLLARVAEHLRVGDAVDGDLLAEVSSIGGRDVGAVDSGRDLGLAAEGGGLALLDERLGAVSVAVTVVVDDLGHRRGLGDDTLLLALDVGLGGRDVVLVRRLAERLDGGVAGGSLGAGLLVGLRGLVGSVGGTSTDSSSASSSSADSSSREASVKVARGVPGVVLGDEDLIRLVDLRGGGRLNGLGGDGRVGDRRGSRRRVGGGRGRRGRSGLVSDETGGSRLLVGNETSGSRGLVGDERDRLGLVLDQRDGRGLVLDQGDGGGRLSLLDGLKLRVKGTSRRVDALGSRLGSHRHIVSELI